MMPEARRISNERMSLRSRLRIVLDRIYFAAARLRRLWHLLILFLVLRLGAGVVLVALDGAAWSIELTLIVAAAVAIYALVALAVRRWAPPRRA